MEAKCGFCNLFGDKLHCGNCRLFKQAEAAFTPKEIKCSLPKLIEICESGNVEEHVEVGDYKHIKLPYGGKIKLVLADIDKDILASDKTKAKTTWLIFGIDGKYEIDKLSVDMDDSIYIKSKMHTQYMNMFKSLLPKPLVKALKQVIKNAESHDRYLSKSSVDYTFVDSLFLLSASEIYEIAGLYQQKYKYFDRISNAERDSINSPTRSKRQSYKGDYFVLGGYGIITSNCGNFLPVILGCCI